MTDVRPLNRFHYLSPDGNKYYFWKMLQSHSNLGIPPVKFIEDSGPQQHGVNVRDWRINPRTITFEFFREGESCIETRGEILARMINAIRPNRGYSPSDSGWLRFVNDNETMVEIPVFVLQGPTGDYAYNGPIGKWQVQDSLQFYAPDPIWRETEKKFVKVGGEELEPSCLSSCPAEYSASSSDIEQTIVSDIVNENMNINYVGDTPGTDFSIVIGPGKMSSPVITNANTGAQIIFSGNPTSNTAEIHIVKNGTTVTITNESAVDISNYVTNLSDLYKFYLMPNTVNVINITGTGGDPETEPETLITVSWNNTDVTFDCVSTPFCLGDNCLIPVFSKIKLFNILYTGTWNGDQIDIELNGPMTQPIILNATTGKKIELNYIISSGETVYITIRPEYAIIVNNNGDNLIGTVTSVSDLVDFLLACAGAITPNGNNVIQISVIDGDWTVSYIRVDYYTRHISAYGNPEEDRI